MWGNLVLWEVLLIFQEEDAEVQWGRLQRDAPGKNLSEDWVANSDSSLVSDHVHTNLNV